MHREELVFAHRNHTLVAEVAYRGGVFHVLVSAVYTYIFLMVEGGVVPVALPVVVGEYDGLGRVYRVRHRLPARRHFFAVGEISRRVDGRFRHVACTGSVGSVEHQVGVRALKGGRTHYGEIFPGVGEVPPAGRGREAYLGVEDYVRLLVGVALAGGDYDYAVGCAASVYGCRGGVFEHLYGFDIVRIDFGEGALDTVHQAERVVAAVDGGAASYEEARCLAREVVVGGHPEAGHLALEGVSDRGYRRSHELVAVHLGYGCGQGLAGLGSVADHHGILKKDGVVFQDYVYAVFLAYRYADAAVAYAGEFENTG